jgi:hypothetical protein
VLISPWDENLRGGDKMRKQEAIEIIARLIEERGE